MSESSAKSRQTELLVPVPAGAWDTHFHVFDAPERAQPAAGTPYVPPDAPMTKLDAMHRYLGIDRGVMVQSAAVRADYGRFVEQLRSNPRLHGVVRATEDLSDRHLEELHAAGVRGVRFAFARYMKQERPSIAAIQKMADRVKALGWHLKLHVDSSDLQELRDMLRSATVPVLIDHAANVKPASGVGHADFRLLLELHQRDNCWVLLGNFDRWSESGRPLFLDAIPLARAIIRNAPERVIWGTDWPHPMYRNPYSQGEPAPDERELLNLVAEAAERDGATIERILVRNPLCLYET